MGFDLLLKRYFPVVICLLIGIAAYFQASGVSQLVAGTIADGAPEVKASPSRRLGSLSSAPIGARKSADPILERNPFDSITGPLTASELDLGTVEPPKPMNATDPFEDPECDSAKVLLITASDDPEWSFAAIAGSDGKSQLRRQGDEVGDSQVYFIGWDRVWMMHDGMRCQATVGSDVKVAKAKAPVAAKPKSGRRKSKVVEEIESKIQKVSDTEFNVDRSVVDLILQNQGELMRSARIVPEKKGDTVVGVRMFGIKSDSLLSTLGMQNGDSLRTINGFDMASPEKALEAYARLRTADHLTVAVSRGGTPVNIDFNIK